MHGGMNTAVDRSDGVFFVVAFGAEVHSSGALVMPRHVQCMVDQLVDSLVFRRRNGYDRNSERRLQIVYADRAAVRAHLVHHIQRQDHRNPKLHELHGEVKIPLDVGGVDDIDNAARAGIQKEIARYDLFTRIRGQRINTGQIGHGGFRMIADRTVLAVDGDAGKISDVLIGARELIEKGRLAAVLIAGKGKGKRFSLRNGAVAVRRMICLGAKLAHAGVRREPAPFGIAFGDGLFGMYVLDRDLLRLGKT